MRLPSVQNCLEPIRNPSEKLWVDGDKKRATDQPAGAAPKKAKTIDASPDDPKEVSQIKKGFIKFAWMNQDIYVTPDGECYCMGLEDGVLPDNKPICLVL